MRTIHEKYAEGRHVVLDHSKVHEHEKATHELNIWLGLVSPLTLLVAQCAGSCALHVESPIQACIANTGTQSQAMGASYIKTDDEWLADER